MATDWFIEVDGRTLGPFSAKQLKAQVKGGRIHSETRIRRGRGKWHFAKNVKGLINESVGKSSKSSAAESGVEAENQRPANQGAANQNKAIQVAEESTFLAPVRTRKIRGILCGCLVALVAIGTTPIWQKLIFALSMVLLFGSYPLIELKKKTIEQTLIIGFFPAHTQKWKTRDFVSVIPSTEARITDTIGCLVFFFFWYWFLFRLFDHLMPWLGGNYKLSLKRYDDEEMLIWQGNSAADFEANLALFEEHGLSIT